MPISSSRWRWIGEPLWTLDAERWKLNVKGPAIARAQKPEFRNPKSASMTKSECRMQMQPQTGCAGRRGMMAAMGWVLRIFVKAAAALSVFLLVASVILWVRSYFVGHLIRHIGPDVIPHRSYFISSTTGGLSLSIYEQTWKDPAVGGGRYPPGFSFERWDSRAEPFIWPSGTSANALGFAAEHKSLGEGEDYTLVVPYYALTLALLAPPLVWWVRFRRRARAAAGLRCAGCGYDLRATPDRCPECGRAANGA
jgi:hypothetical protein